MPKEPRFVLLGTMAAINARRIDGLPEPEYPIFFYNNNANKFWRYMWELFEGTEKPKEISVDGKHAFCERHGMAICNVVAEMEIHKDDAECRLDDIIFEAEEKGLLTLKEVKADFKKCLKTLPTFFTRYSHTDDRLVPLLKRFYKENGVNESLVDEISFMHTPAMGSPKRALPVWRKAMKDLL